MGMKRKKNIHAVILGRLGGKAGTGASKARTSEQARKAALSRGKKKAVVLIAAFLTCTFPVFAESQKTDTNDTETAMSFCVDKIIPEKGFISRWQKNKQPGEIGGPVFLSFTNTSELVLKDWFPKVDKKGRRADIRIKRIGVIWLDATHGLSSRQRLPVYYCTVPTATKIGLNKPTREYLFDWTNRFTQVGVDTNRFSGEWPLLKMIDANK